MPKTRGKDKPSLLEEMEQRKAEGRKLTKQMQRIDEAISKTRATVDYRGGIFTLEIFDVPKSLNERDKQRWWVKMEDKAIWLGIVKKALAEATCEIPMQINKDSMVFAYWQQYRVHPLDYDNSISGIKHIQDALVDAGVLYADDWKHIYKLCPERDTKVKHMNEQRCVLSYEQSHYPVEA